MIDGAIADATVFSNLDPNTIESISFLKDAASSAIYGSRAAYGVVLVTTKGGKAEKMNVAYSGYVGVKTPTYLPDVLDSWDYATLLNEAKYNANPSGGKIRLIRMKKSDGLEMAAIPITIQIRIGLIWYWTNMC